MITTFDISPAFITVHDTGIVRYVSPSTASEIGQDGEQARKFSTGNRVLG